MKFEGISRQKMHSECAQMYSDWDISLLEVDEVVKKHLRAGNVKNLGQLVHMADEDVLKISGVGKKRLKEIKEGLGGFGLSLYKEESKSSKRKEVAKKPSADDKKCDKNVPELCPIKRRRSSTPSPRKSDFRPPKKPKLNHMSQKVKELAAENARLTESEESKDILLKKMELSRTNSVENFLSCAVCLDVLAYPTSISCGHTFCMKCIIEVNGPCPKCRLPFQKDALRLNLVIDHTVKNTLRFGKLEEITEYNERIQDDHKILLQKFPTMSSPQLIDI